jgi:hypothetical protein
VIVLGDTWQWTPFMFIVQIAAIKTGAGCHLSSGIDSMLE